MNRRDMLRTLAGASAIATAGCSSLFGTTGTALGKVEVINSSFVPNRIRLLITRGDETLYDRKLSLPPIEGDSGPPIKVIDPFWSEEPGPYTIHAIHYETEGEGDERESIGYEYTVTRDDYRRYYGDRHEDPGCIGAVVKIGSLAEQENAPIAIGPMNLENPCGSQQNEY